MFKSALVKLTGLYLLILVLVSLLFSVSLYKIATNEVNNRLRHQVDFFNTQPEAGISIGGTAGGIRTFNVMPFEQQRTEELIQTKQHVLWELVYANLLVFILGGLGSYLLAKHTLKPIEESHAAQTRFVTDASHELRTPIAAMRTETEVALRDKKLSIKDARDLLVSNVEELDRLGKLSEGLLLLARGHQATDLQEVVKLPLVIKDAIQQVLHQAEAKHITIATHDVPKVEVLGNKIQLVQLMVILLDNAIKYSEPKQPIVVSGSTEHNHVRLKVADSGVGINASNLNHIFERFYRADSARSSQNTSGNGLGLAIAKQIAEAHRGNIEATSTPGSGSLFAIVLPIKKT